MLFHIPVALASFLALNSHPVVQVSQEVNQAPVAIERTIAQRSQMPSLAKPSSLLDGKSILQKLNSQGPQDLSSLQKRSQVERVGVLLASHGDIDSLSELENYAKTAVMKNPAVPLPSFARGIASKLGWLAIRKEIINQYHAIGEHTNYRANSELQAEALEKALETSGIEADVFYGYNFEQPFVADALEAMQKDNVKHIVVFNQGAQYSYATTAEDFMDVHDYLDDNKEFAPEVLGVKQFSDDPRFRSLLSKRLVESIEKAFPGVPYEDICIVMGSHGLPEPLLEKNDPAVAQMINAVNDIKSRLPEGLLVKHGFLNDNFFPGVAWTHPTAEELVDSIVQSGRKHILLDGRLSFTVHHRATFYDLNVETRQKILAMMPDAQVALADNFNSDPELARLFADLTIEALEGKQHTVTVAPQAEQVELD